MLSLYSNELARRSTYTCLSCTSLLRVLPPVTASAPLTTFRSSSPFAARSHQRKHSSSKIPSRPAEPPRIPDTTTNTTPATESKRSVPRDDTAASVQCATAESVEAIPTNSPHSPRHKAAGCESTQAPDHRSLPLELPSLPSVPSTNHIAPLDIHVASFFSQHRPLSVSHVIPPRDNSEAFLSLFSTSKSSSSSSQKPPAAEVIYTLSSAVEALEHATSPAGITGQGHDMQDNEMPKDFDLHTAVSQATLHQSPRERQQFDRIPADGLRINLQELAKRFRPFMAPPPPAPMNALREAMHETARSHTDNALPRARRQRAWTSTLTVLESTDLDGLKTFESFATPVTRTPVRNAGDDGQDLDNHRVSLPDADQTQPARYAISVRRQRKLKMKKHKYKKLMKRTKNLRRRLDRT